jgi:hypothetical protein
MSTRAIAILIATLLTTAQSAQAQWEFGADFLLPTRHTRSNVTFARNQAAGAAGTVARLDEDDLELDLTAGGRITVSNRTGMFGLQGSYVGTTEWNEVATVFDPAGGLASPFTPVGGVLNPNFDNNTSIVVDYTTELHTADINLTQMVYSGMNGTVFLLYGGRYMSLEESLNYSSDNAVLDHNLLTTTDNRAFGPQLGVAIEAPLGASLLNLSFKSALGYNTVDKTTNLDGVLGTGTDQDATFMSEIDVHCVLTPVQYVAVRVGWQFLSATDMALATDNFERNLTVLGSGVANVRSDRKVFYHTPYVGLVVTY